MTEEAHPADRPPKHPAWPSCHLVFTAAGDLCRAHIGINSGPMASSHAEVISGFAVQVPVTADFRNS